MKKIARRTMICLLVVLFLLGGLSIYLVKLVKDGGDWVSFPVNRHVYSNARLAVGTITDRNGEILATVSGRERVYSGSELYRRSTLHVVGDRDGNIGTGALSHFATELMGYDIVNGVFSVNGEGSTMRLTIDADLNAAAYEALGGRKGAVTVYNYKTGDVLCMVSTPSYDPYNTLNDSDLASDAYEGAYINRCISSTYTPGSVFKIVTLAAAIENIPDLYEMEFYCPGYVDIDGERINCNGVHGYSDINDSFAHSCNVTFAQLAQILGGETIEKYMGDYGLLDSFSMSGIDVASGSYTVAPDGSHNLSWSGIGQYHDLVNPAAMARLMGAIANGGTAVRPKIVKGMTSSLGIPAGLRFAFRGSDRLMKKTTADTLSEMMRYNVTSVYNGYYNFSSFDGLSAKSGTAEMDNGKAPHAWFVGYLDNKDYPIAFSVVIENAGWGLEQAGRVANVLLNNIVQ